tara:strand:- start:2460 stop:2960 length:501 start_codon:yes stop_codon:yes gene_type:complete
MLHENVRLLKYYILGSLLQITVFESFDFLGYIDPIFYLIFILIYKFDGNHIKLILLSFSLGLIIDLLTQNPGSNTISCIIIAYIRPLLINFSFGVNSDISNGMVSGTRIENRFLFIVLIILIHHFIYFSISYFSYSALISILRDTFLTALLTIILIGITLGFISKK